MNRWRDSLLRKFLYPWQESSSSVKNPFVKECVFFCRKTQEERPYSHYHKYLLQLSMSYTIKFSLSSNKENDLACLPAFLPAKSNIWWWKYYRQNWQLMIRYSNPCCDSDDDNVILDVVVDECVCVCWRQWGPYGCACLHVCARVTERGRGGNLVIRKKKWGNEKGGGGLIKIRYVYVNCFLSLSVFISGILLTFQFIAINKISYPVCDCESVVEVGSAGTAIGATIGAAIVAIIGYCCCRC